MSAPNRSSRGSAPIAPVVGLLIVGANTYPLVTSFLAGLRPTAGIAARNPSAHRSLIAYAAWSSVAHTAVMALMAMHLPTKRGDLLWGVAVTGLSAVLLFVCAPSSTRSQGAVPV